jgi:hypothetical protein
MGGGNSSGTKTRVELCGFMRCRAVLWRVAHSGTVRTLWTALYYFLSSPIRTIPSALELRQVLLLSRRERLAGCTADQELGNIETFVPSPCPEDIAYTY